MSRCAKKKKKAQKNETSPLQNGNWNNKKKMMIINTDFLTNIINDMQEIIPYIKFFNFVWVVLLVALGVLGLITILFADSADWGKIRKPEPNIKPPAPKPPPPKPKDKGPNPPDPPEEGGDLKIPGA